MRSGKALLVSEEQGRLIGQAEMQRLVRIEEGSRGAPKPGEESEQGDADCGHAGMALKPFALVFL